MIQRAELGMGEGVVVENGSEDDTWEKLNRIHESPTLGSSTGPRSERQ